MLISISNILVCTATVKVKKVISGYGFTVSFITLYNLFNLLTGGKTDMFGNENLQNSNLLIICGASKFNAPPPPFLIPNFSLLTAFHIPTVSSSGSSQKSFMAPSAILPPS